MGVGRGISSSSVGENSHGSHPRATRPPRNDGGCEARGKVVTSRNL